MSYDAAVLDPLPGPDRWAWEALLAAAWERDGGHKPDGFVGLLRGLRCLGCRIQGNRIVGMPSEDLAAMLGSRRPEVNAMLGGLDVA